MVKKQSNGLLPKIEMSQCLKMRMMVFVDGSLRNSVS